MKVILKNVRCSYVYIRAPRKNKEKPEDAGTYQLQVLLDKDKNADQIKQIKKASLLALAEKFGKNAKPGMYKMPLRDGDAERDTDENPEYKNCAFFNCNSGKDPSGNPRKPGIVNRYNEGATDKDFEDMGFSGCYFHVSINFYGYNSNGNKGVGAGLGNVMLYREGERLDGRTSAKSEFAEFAEDASDDFDDDFDDDTPF